jgi:hypothetical protein
MFWKHKNCKKRGYGCVCVLDLRANTAADRGGPMH